jgi:hypothetical protein
VAVHPDVEVIRIRIRSRLGTGPDVVPLGGEIMQQE